MLDPVALSILRQQAVAPGPAVGVAAAALIVNGAPAPCVVSLSRCARKEPRLSTLAQRKEPTRRASSTRLRGGEGGSVAGPALRKRPELIHRYLAPPTNVEVRHPTVGHAEVATNLARLLD